MDKPLEEWTLAETRYFCEHHDCPECPLIWGEECVLKTSPDIWDFPARPKYTENEITLAKLLLKAGVEAVQSDGGKDLLLDWGNSRSRLPAAAFPSLQSYEVVALKDIAGSEVRNG